jgi:hypothetical protein
MENLHEPPKSLGFEDIRGCPGWIRRYKIAVVFLSFVFEGNDKPLRPMSADMESGAGNGHPDLVSSPDSKDLGD